MKNYFRTRLCFRNHELHGTLTVRKPVGQPEWASVIFHPIRKQSADILENLIAVVAELYAVIPLYMKPKAEQCSFRQRSLQSLLGNFQPGALLPLLRSQQFQESASKWEKLMLWISLALWWQRLRPFRNAGNYICKSAASSTVSLSLRMLK